MKQDSRSVSEFFTALKVLWEELEAYLPTPVCACPHRCTCNIGVLNAKHQHEITRSIRFLTGLNDQFDLVRSQILLMNPLPTLNKIFSMVLQYERQFRVSIPVDESKVLINALNYPKSQGRGRGYGGSSSTSGSKRVCSFCGRSNHIVDTCYRKHGFPPNFGKNSAIVNNSSLEVHEEREDMYDSKSCKGSDSFGITKEQYEQQVNLLQTQQSSSSKVNHVTNHVTSGISRLSYALNQSSFGSWIVDYGASDHICSSIRVFDSYQSIKPVHIKLPNGNIAIAKFSGTVQFSPGLIAKNVLYVAEFKFNLLSVPKLCVDSDYIVTFDNDKCLIHESRNLKMIVLTDLIEGLYFLATQASPSTKPQPVIASSQTSSKSSSFLPQEALWHFRLGNLSNYRLLSLKQSFLVLRLMKIQSVIYVITLDIENYPFNLV